MPNIGPSSGNENPLDKSFFEKLSGSKIAKGAAGAAAVAGIGGGAAAVVTASVAVGSYQDLPHVFAGKSELGRTKNGLATVLAGEVGRALYGTSNVDFTVEKTMWPDSRVTGSTTKNGKIDTLTELTFTSARYTSANGAGEVDKSELNWTVTQSGPNTWDIGRFGPKFDSELKLFVGEGKITGIFVRNGPAFDWTIDGEYDAEGNVEIRVAAPLTLDITLKGKVTPASPAQ